MKQAYYKGKRIIGTAELQTGTALVTGFDDDEEPLFTGDTKWDDQTTEHKRGSILVVTDSGGVVRLADCEWRDE